MKIFLLNGSKVWLDPETAPAEAIPLSKPKKEAKPVKAEEPEVKAKPATANKAKKPTANKAKKGSASK